MQSAIPKIAKVAFWVSVAISLYFAISPVPAPIAQETSDKILHMLAFAAMATCGTIGFPKLSGWRLGLYLSAFGAGIEFVQAVPFLHRDSEFMDWVADTAAAFFVIAVLREVLEQSATSKS